MELTDEQKIVAEHLKKAYNSPLGQKLFNYQKERIMREGPLSKKKASLDQVPKLH